jgi:hypothetical protein
MRLHVPVLLDLALELIKLDYANDKLVNCICRSKLTMHCAGQSIGVNISRQ